MMLCLVAGALVVGLGSDRASLEWRHSVERQIWQEDWRATAAGVVIERARVRGSGAGMEPGEGAVLVDGAWTWTPSLPPLDRVVLARSGATADWRICVAGRCRAIGDRLPAGTDAVALARCDDDGGLTSSGGTGR